MRTAWPSSTARALYEHADPREGFHQDWNTLIYNLGRNEVRGFLIASALQWLERFHVDGLRVDAVASMLYRDYSAQARASGFRIVYGGRENLEAIDFLRELNAIVARALPGRDHDRRGITAWPGVTAPVDSGGLGFAYKWNMGWMHDTLRYMSEDPVHRRWHHDDMTFGLLYAFSERFVLPLSHDEVVHGKAFAARQDAGRPLAALRQPARVFRLHVGASGQETAVHGRRVRAGRANGITTATSTVASARRSDAIAACSGWSRDLNRALRARAGAASPRQRRARLPLDRRRRPRQQRVRLVAPRRTATPPCSSSPISRRCRARLSRRRAARGRWREMLNTDARDITAAANMGNGGGVHADAVAAHGHAAVACADVAAARPCSSCDADDADYSESHAHLRPTRSRHALIRSAHTGMGSASISPCSPRMPTRSNCVCSIPPAGAKSTRLALPECTDEVWHGYLPRCDAGAALRLSRARSVRARAGPSLQSAQAAARSVRQRAASASCAGPTRCSAIASTFAARRSRSIAATARRDAEGCGRRRQLQLGRRPAAARAVGDTVIYEAHVRGLTHARDMVSAERERGTFAALADPHVDRASARLGITADRTAAGPRFHAGPLPDRARPAQLLGLQHAGVLRARAALSGRAVGSNEMRVAGAPAARGRHRGDSRRGLQPHLRRQRTGADAVAGAASTTRPTTVSLPDKPRHHINDTGCGNTLNCSHPRVLQMVMDSLRYWVESFHVDGFRFDLGVTLGREATRLRSRLRLLRRAAPGPGAVAASS